MSGATILAVNAGSSSLKFALYPADGGTAGSALLSGQVDGLQPGGEARLQVQHYGGAAVTEALPAGGGEGHARALQALRQVLSAEPAAASLRAVAHRIVHGGQRYSASVLLDGVALDYLAQLNSLAPLHQPHNLAGVAACSESWPELPQVGCFDTGFHATLPPEEQWFALPQALHAQGVRRYGFHGLSYRYVSAQLARRSARASGRVLMAHLGNGASVCATLEGLSVATSMGFSALDGLMMGTRSGALDPGVLLYLLRQGWSAQRIEDLLYRESGLLGVSGLSADMRRLRASSAPTARQAIALFEHRVLRECGAQAACLGGLDLLAFTGGIGEHDAALRLAVCQQLRHLGVAIDADANRQADGTAVQAIHAPGSAVELWVVPTDEGRVAASDAAALPARLPAASD
jgi:acetate kinase